MTFPHSFEPTKPLDAVVSVFWERGYAEATYEDLAEASGVGRKGLYGTFGNKEAMFGRALLRYRELFVESLLSDLRNPTIRPTDIAHLLFQIGGLLASKEGRVGCLMANTAVDDACRIAAVRVQVSEHLTLMSATFTKALRRCNLSDQLSGSLADYLTGTLQGLFVLGRAHAGKQMIGNCTQTIIRNIVPPASSEGPDIGFKGMPCEAIALPGFEKFRSMIIQRRRFSELVAKARSAR